MRYIFTMSFAGSLLLLLYCITNNKIVKLFSYKLQDILLKGVLFYYLVPLVFLEPLYREVIYRLHIPSRLVSAGVYENIYYYGDVDGEIRFNESYKLQIGIFLVWFLIALVILLVRIYKYLKRKKGLLSTASQITEGVVFELLEKVRMEQNIKRKIRLYDMQTPAFTMGVLQPIICFDSSMSIGELEMTFRHECGHIRRWDVFTRQCVSLAVNIHWFNPLIYLLPQKAERIFEICCDEAVIRNADKASRAEYAQMILEQTMAVVKSSLFYSALSENAKVMEERIKIIMKPRTRTKLQTALAVLLLGIVFFADSWTVLAYPDAKRIKLNSWEDFDADEEFIFVEDGAEGPYDSLEYEVLYESQFIDEEGNIYPIYEGDVSVAAGHTHTWVTGKRQKHVINSDGSCTIYIYAAQRCSDCGAIEQGELISTTNYYVCPH